MDGRRIHTAFVLRDPPSGQEIMHFLARHRRKRPPAWARALVDGDCWIWTGCKDKDGYGKMKYRGQNWRTHRWSCAVFNNVLLKGVEGHHECYNPRCNNPDHLVPMAKKLNAAMKPPKKRVRRKPVEAI